MLLVILFSALAGIIGTGLGGLVGVLWGNKSENAVSVLLGFAGGVMLSVVCFELMPEASRLAGLPLTLSGLVIGICVILLLSDSISRYSRVWESGNSMRKTGWIMLAAMALHNFPEGIAIGAGGVESLRLGITLALAIALHDLPEGMAVSLPLSAGGVKKGKSFLLAVFSGVITLFGGIVGVSLGTISPKVIATCIASAGGAMLYVTCQEIFPQILTEKRKYPPLAIIVGIVAGFVLSQLPGA